MFPIDEPITPVDSKGGVVRLGNRFLVGRSSPLNAPHGVLHCVSGFSADTFVGTVTDFLVHGQNTTHSQIVGEFVPIVHICHYVCVPARSEKNITRTLGVL